MPHDRKPIPISLNYTNAVFGPQPHAVKVGPGDTLVFTKGPGPGSKLRITIHDTQNFEPSTVQHDSSHNGSEPLRVVVGNGFTTGTTYKCEPLDAQGNAVLDEHGRPIGADGATGGEIEPDTGL